MSDSIILLAKLVGYIFQLIGVSVLLTSNALFYFQAKKQGYGSVKKAFVNHVGAQFAYSHEELQKADADEAIQKFPLAGLLFRNYRNNVIGVIVTMLGVVISFVGLLA
jgi:hypothetical protein